MKQSSNKFKIIWKLLAFRLFIGSIIVILLPWFILSAHSPILFQFDILTICGMGLFIIGSAFYLRCIWDFAVLGHADNPNIIIATGSYKFTRNPMYIGLVLILLSESLIFRSERLLGYALGFWIFIHLLVILYEERALKKKFGLLYENYCKEVPRWIPNFRKTFHQALP